MNYPTNPLFNDNNSQQDQMNRLKGTTGLALKFKNGALVIADRRASMGSFTASKHAKKVHKVNDYTGIGIAGSVSDAQALVDLLRSELRLYQLENNFEPSIKVAGSLLATIMHGSFRRFQPWWVQLLVAGVDRRGSHVYVLGPDGSISDEDFFAIGSGTLLSIGVLEHSYKPDLDKEKAKDLAIAALKTSLARDNATGNGIDGLIFFKVEDQVITEEIHIDM
ncbi:proteasome subunit beta [Candidatus Heimdallarchaeota archaeon B3_Heim]|nr:MAG: proteasome subunit beta [Candidatus Heimdallarchaeota archaeon B3_Heim]